MIDAKTLEKELLICLERLIFLADFIELENTISKLTELGYKVHIKVNPDKKLYNFYLKKYQPEIKALLSEKETLSQLVITEKCAAIRSQKFDYAANLRDLEKEIDNISKEEAYRKLASIVNLNFEYLIAIHLHEIFIVIQSELHFLVYLEDELHKITSQKYSLKIEAIKENVVEDIKLNASIRKLLQKNYDTANENRLAYVAYVAQNRSKEVIYLQPFSKIDRKPLITLKEHLNEIDCSDIWSLTLLSTFYIELDKPLMPYIGIKNPILDNILSDSLGWLAYPHQLIALFSIATGIKSNEKIAKFVEGFNNKYLKEIDAYLNQSLFGSTLGEIVNERILSKQGNIMYPNFYYGFKLLNFLS